MRLDWTLFMLSSFWMVVGFAPKSWFKRQLQPFCGEACLLKEISNPLLCCYQDLLKESTPLAWPRWFREGNHTTVATIGEACRPFGRRAGGAGGATCSFDCKRFQRRKLTQLRRAARKTWRKRCLELSPWVMMSHYEWSHGPDELRMESLQVTSALRRLCLTTRSWTLDTQLQNASKGPEFDLSSNKLDRNIPATIFSTYSSPVELTWTSSFAIRCGLILIGSLAEDI